MVELTNDREFDQLLAEKRHKELTAALDKLVSAINKKKDDKVVEAIDRQVSALRDFLKQMKDEEKPMEMNHDDVVGCVEKLGQDILGGLTELKETITQKSKDWTFTVSRDNMGYIESITAKQQ